MPEVNDPKLLDALERVFITRAEMRSIIDYQQKLFASLQELTNSHRAVHEHVRKLTEAHNRVQDDTGSLARARTEVNQTLRMLDDSHRQTREEMRRAIDAINNTQAEIRKIGQLQQRVENLEREIQRIWQDDRTDDKKVTDQEQRLRRLERK